MSPLFVPCTEETISFVKMVQATGDLPMAHLVGLLCYAISERDELRFSSEAFEAAKAGIRTIRALPRSWPVSRRAAERKRVRRKVRELLAFRAIALHEYRVRTSTFLGGGSWKGRAS